MKSLPDLPRDAALYLAPTEVELRIIWRLITLSSSELSNTF